MTLDNHTHSIEYRTEVLSLVDPDLANKIAQLTAEGWQFVPGTTPVAIYHLQRQPTAPAATSAAFGKMQIDDSKVHIIRGGNNGGDVPPST